MSFSPHVLLRVRTMPRRRRLPVADASPGQIGSRKAAPDAARQVEEARRHARPRRAPRPRATESMKVVKSRRGHGAVSPETARANARTRREAQRRNEAGRNVFTGLDDDAKEEAPPPPPKCGGASPRRPPPPPPKDNSPKQKPPKARRKKAAADDGFVDYRGRPPRARRRRRVDRPHACVWFLPALLYVLRTPHDFSRERFHAVPPPPLRFEILQPAREKLATSEVLEWRLSEDLTRRASATTVGVEIWLDGTRLLEQNLTMPRAGKTEVGDLGALAAHLRPRPPPDGHPQRHRGPGLRRAAAAVRAVPEHVALPEHDGRRAEPRRHVPRPRRSPALFSRRSGHRSSDDDACCLDAAIRGVTLNPLF